jgi:hypothetical protein
MKQLHQYQLAYTSKFTLLPKQYLICRAVCNGSIYYKSNIYYYNTLSAELSQTIQMIVKTYYFLVLHLVFTVERLSLTFLYVFCTFIYKKLKL